MMKIWSSFLNFDHYFILEFSTLSICKIYNESLEDFFLLYFQALFRMNAQNFLGSREMAQKNGTAVHAWQTFCIIQNDNHL